MLAEMPTQTQFAVYTQGTQLDQLPLNTPRRDYLKAWLDQPVSNWIQNAETRMEAATNGDHLIPCTVNNQELLSAYVCSPYAAITRYTLDELEKIKNPFSRNFSLGLIWLSRGPLKWVNLNKNIHVNNWMLSTNLYPKLSPEWIQQLHNHYMSNYPEHAIIYRSLTPMLNQSLMDQLVNMGYLLVPTRQVYMNPPSNHNTAKKKRGNKADFKEIEKTQLTPLAHDDFQASDFTRVKELYDNVYLKKYSQYNPNFTPQFFNLCQATDHFTYQGFRNPQTGKVDGFIGCYEVGGGMTIGTIGYSFDADANKALYRMISAQAFQSAIANNWTQHGSSGAGYFKMLRGALPEMEYTAVYAKHLSIARQSAWKVLQVVSEKFVQPLIQENQI